MPARDDHELPLTEQRAASSPPPPQQPELSADELLIRRLVGSFYESIRADAVLGPVFAANVKDWSQHLPKMEDFWSSMVLRSGRYSGRPIQAHMRLDGLTPAMFDRWLALWRETVNAIAPPAARAPFINAAERMAANMRGAIIGE